MFKASQEIRLNASSSAAQGESLRNIGNNNNNSNNHNSNDNESDCLFGKYQRTPDADEYPTNIHNIFVAPELTDVSKIQLLHFPNGAVRMNSEVKFIIKRNGVKGNFEIKLESPSGIITAIPLRFLDPERFEVSFNINQAGLYKLHIKCNSVALPRSPLIIVSICGEIEKPSPNVQMPIFKSDASKVSCRGLGLTHISIEERNEFTVDGSAAGSNILFVGIFGPNGQCDEVVIKHLGKNIYKVTYQVQDQGNYILAAKWGEEHIPGSPFCLSAL